MQWHPLVLPYQPRTQHDYHHDTKVKPEDATAVVLAPDDGHEDARTVLSCILTTSNELEKLLHLFG